ncbi:MAG TPA: hypothetical protein VM243_17265, partial [Phycisphaerae bacterium]|nr:hypothetical protein [Phycisphaerae bacterium]
MDSPPEPIVARFNIERFKRLPQTPGVAWQGGLFRMPGLSEGNDDQPYRPLIALWVSESTGRASKPRMIEPDGEPLPQALDSLVAFALSGEGGSGRPAAVEVNDADLAAYLEDRLAGTGVVCRWAPDLVALQDALDRMGEEFVDRPEPPSLLGGKGVTVEQVRAFAEAAARFYKARPWDELTDQDLIVVERPKPPVEMTYASVLGSAGQTIGLGFFKNLKQFDNMLTASDPSRYLARHVVWSLTFGPIMELPSPDADLWKDHGLPVANEEAYPFAARFSPRTEIRRPNAKQLAFLEGLLRALADNTGDQLDAGRWSVTVSTLDGPVEYRLALVSELADATDAAGRWEEQELRPQDLRRTMERDMVDLQRLLAKQEFGSTEEANAFLASQIKDGRVPRGKPETALEQAQELMYQAWEARGRRRRKLARQALEICADCADAYVLLAEEVSDLDEACTLYRQGVEAGERSLGRATFREEAGQFWGILETRPYMRAREGLARGLWASGHQEEAVKHYRDLLRLNPDDNQGIRYVLAACLLELGKDRELSRLLDRYEEDSAQWLYLRALSTFRREGNTPLARKQVKQAINGNPHVPSFLLGRRELPWSLPELMGLGNEDEAVHVATEMEEGWKATPGALEWLEELD